MDERWIVGGIRRLNKQDPTRPTDAPLGSPAFIEEHRFVQPGHLARDVVHRPRRTDASTQPGDPVGIERERRNHCGPDLRVFP